MKTKLVYDDPEYWRRLARNERAFAKEKRENRWGTVEAIAIHIVNAKTYEEFAAKLEAKATESV